jgi:hypothetical protein
MKRAIKVVTSNHNELIIGFDYEMDKANLEIESLVVEDFLQYEQVDKLGLKEMLNSFKECIDEVLVEIENVQVNNE